MIGSHLLGQQPTFAGADFGMPEIALFGYYQFRNAVPTTDDWERHDGVELLFLQSGEACWDLPDDHFSLVTGNQAMIFPPRQRHRISNGIYTPCRLFWLVFRDRAEAEAKARLFLPTEISALFDMAREQERPVDLPQDCHRAIGELGERLECIRSRLDAVTLVAQERYQSRARVRFVIDHQDSTAALRVHREPVYAKNMPALARVILR